MIRGRVSPHTTGEPSHPAVSQTTGRRNPLRRANSSNSVRSAFFLTGCV
ncbi:MAG TPA: hypothetical protein PKV38_08035 [bacterium]|nr:hypothetical protein [bacterium]